MRPAQPDLIHKRFKRILERVDAEYEKFWADLDAIDRGARGGRIKNLTGRAAEPVGGMDETELGSYQDETPDA